MDWYCFNFAPTNIKDLYQNTDNTICPIKTKLNLVCVPGLFKTHVPVNYVLL